LQRLLWVHAARLEVALRAAELLQKAGFVLVILDLAGVEARALQRLGQGPWLRMRRLARARASTVLVLSRESHPWGQCFSGSAAALGLVFEKRRARFEDGLFEGIETRARVVRQRAGMDGGAFELRLWQRAEAG